MRCSQILLFFFLSVIALPVVAQSIGASPEARLETLSPDEQQEARALWNRLRCVVCSGQSIAQSNAPIAEAIRLRVIEELAGGKDSATIERELAARYGTDVLLSPPMEGSTQLLWLAPLMFLLFGIGLLIIQRRKSKGDAA